MKVKKVTEEWLLEIILRMYGAFVFGDLYDFVIQTL